MSRQGEQRARGDVQERGYGRAESVRQSTIRKETRVGRGIGIQEGARERQEMRRKKKEEEEVAERRQVARGFLASGQQLADKLPRRSIMDVAHLRNATTPRRRRRWWCCAASWLWRCCLCLLPDPPLPFPSSLPQAFLPFLHRRKPLLYESPPLLGVFRSSCSDCWPNSRG